MVTTGMVTTGMVSGIADVHHSKLEEYVSFLPLDVFINSILFSEKVSLLMRTTILVFTLQSQKLSHGCSRKLTCV